VVSLCLALFEEQVVAALSRALKHVRVLVPNLLPLKLLAPVHLFWSQKLSEVRQRNGVLAIRLGAQDRQLLIFNARVEPRLNARNVINVAADAQRKHLVECASKEGLLANLAHVLSRLLFDSVLSRLQLGEYHGLNLHGLLVLELSLLLLSSKHLLPFLLLFESPRASLLLAVCLQVFLSFYLQKVAFFGVVRLQRRRSIHRRGERGERVFSAHGV